METDSVQKREKMLSSRNAFVWRAGYSFLSAILFFLPKITMDIEVKQNLTDMFPKSIKEISWKWKIFLLEVCSGQSRFGALKEESALLWIKDVFYKLVIIVAIFTQMLRTRSKTELRLCREKSTLEETVIS